MSWAKVQGAQSAGASNATSIAISAATAGNTIVSFFSQTGLNTPTCSGFTVDPFSQIYNTGGTDSGWVAYKIATGGETSVAWTAGTSATGRGVCATELSGGPPIIALDGSIVGFAAVGAATAISSPTITTLFPNSIVLLGVIGLGSSGTINAWTGTNVATNIGTVAARTFGGHFVTTSTISSIFTANWTTSGLKGIIGIALQLDPAIKGRQPRISGQAVMRAATRMQGMTKGWRRTRNGILVPELVF